MRFAVSDAALDLAGTKAAGADIHPFCRAVDDDVDGLNVGRPTAPGLPVGMADQIAGHDAFVANLTKLGHAVHLLTDR